MKKIFDISWPISPEMTAYKDKKVVHFNAVKTFEQDNVRETVITLGAHSGTHIDVPAHFLPNGTTTEHILLEQLVGECIVLDLSDVVSKITQQDLQQYDNIVAQHDIVLLKTKNSTLNATDAFNAEFIYLEESVARYLCSKKIKAVGIDYLGIERNQPAHPTHKVLMEHAILIVEGLRLREVSAGRYQFICLPLLIVGLEAAPARAILIKEK